MRPCRLSCELKNPERSGTKRKKGRHTPEQTGRDASRQVPSGQSRQAGHRMKNLIILGLVVALAGCGQRASAPSNSGPLITRSVSSASGPISRACMASSRKSKSPALCGCIQAVANQSLSGGQQNRAARFYADPHEAQVVRQSDRSADEAFWEAYVAYAERAKSLCG